jgi:hypothetical protein
MLAEGVENTLRLVVMRGVHEWAEMALEMGRCFVDRGIR